jgi:hypothetical protein
MSTDLSRLSKSELIAEIRRLRGEPEPSFEEQYGRVEVNRAKPSAIFAGMALQKDDLLVVNEETHRAYIHPEVQVVPGQVRIHGYAARSYQKGQQVRIRHWFDYEPS